MSPYTMSETDWLEDTSRPATRNTAPIFVPKSVADVTPEVIDLYVRQAKEMRAQAMYDMAAAVVRAVKRLFAGRSDRGGEIPGATASS